MNSEGTFSICESCRSPSKADAPGVLPADGLVHRPDLSGGDKIIEGIGASFTTPLPQEGIQAQDELAQRSLLLYERFARRRCGTAEGDKNGENQAFRKLRL